MEWLNGMLIYNDFVCRATLDDGAANVPRIPPYDVGGVFTRMGEVFA